MSGLSAVVAKFLIQQAVVYAENATTGRYTDVALAALACRLIPLSTSGNPVRAEQVNHRRFYYDVTQTIDEHAEVVVDGDRWAVVAGTLDTWSDPGGAPLANVCDVVRVVS